MAEKQGILGPLGKQFARYEEKRHDISVENMLIKLLQVTRFIIIEIHIKKYDSNYFILGLLVVVVGVGVVVVTISQVVGVSNLIHIVMKLTQNM